MILIIGIRAPIGRWLCKALGDYPGPIHALVRDIQDTRKRLGAYGDRITLSQGTTTDRAAIAKAAKSATCAYLEIATHRPDDEIPILATVAEAGVQRVVKVSRLGAAESCPIELGRVHFEIEHRAAELGIDATFLRPGLLMDNLLGQLQRSIARGRLPSVAQGGRVSWIHPRDIAEVAAAALTQPGHSGRIYELTGPEAISYDELALRLSIGMGRRVEHVRLTESEYAGELRALGAAESTVAHLTEMYSTAVRGGFFDVVTGAVEATLGRPATSIDTWIQERRRELLGDAEVDARLIQQPSS